MKLMTNLNAMLYAGGSLLCLTSAVRIGFGTNKHAMSLHFLAWFLGFYALIFLFKLPAVVATIPVEHITVGIWLPLYCLLPPSMWFFVREQIGRRRYKFKHIGWRQFEVPLISIVLVMPYNILPNDSKLALFNSSLLEQKDDIELLARLVAIYVVIVVFVFQFLYYLIKSQRLLVLHARNIRQLFSNVENKTLGWLRWVLRLLMLIWLAHAAGFLVDSVIELEQHWQSFTASMEITLLALLVFKTTRQREIFNNSNWVALAETGTAQVKRNLNDAPTDKHAKAGLTKSTRGKILKKLEEVIRQQKLYRDKELTLKKFSDSIGVESVYVSQVINQDFHSDFFDYINSQRIEEATQLLRAQPKRKIINIARAVGFNTKSTFNKAFKHQNKKTPKKYRRQA